MCQGADRQGMVIRKTNEFESSIKCGVQERERLIQSAKKIVVEGQLLWVKEKRGEKGYLVQVAGQWGGAEDETAIKKLQVKWYPKVYVKQENGKGWLTIFGDKVAREPAAETVNSTYVSPEEILTQVLDRRAAKKSTVKMCLNAQWDTKSEYNRTLSLEDTPGIGTRYLWELDTSEWEISKIFNAQIETHKRKARVKTGGTTRSIKQNVRTIKVTEANIGPQITFKKEAGAGGQNEI